MRPSNDVPAVYVCRERWKSQEGHQGTVVPLKPGS